MPIQAFMSYSLIHYKCSGIPFMFPKQDTVVAWLCLLPQISLLAYQTICVQWPQFPVQTCNISELTWPHRPHSKGADCGTKMKAGGRQGSPLQAAECYRLYCYAWLCFFGEPVVNTAHKKWWVCGCLSATAALRAWASLGSAGLYQPSCDPHVVRDKWELKLSDRREKKNTINKYNGEREVQW